MMFHNLSSGTNLKQIDLGITNGGATAKSTCSLNVSIPRKSAVDANSSKAGRYCGDTALKSKGSAGFSGLREYMMFLPTAALLYSWTLLNDGARTSKWHDGHDGSLLFTLCPTQVHNNMTMGGRNGHFAKSPVAMDCL